MTVSWTRHRFSGGVLALDAANTVVLRGDPRGFDRFDDLSEMSRFADAATHFCADELDGQKLAVDDAAAIAPRVLAIREAIDLVFRAAAVAGAVQPAHLPPLLRACAAGLDSLAGQQLGDAATPLAFDAALAISALSLLSDGAARRTKICQNCRWLFLDRSRNSSRLWCDMTVCGNRRKASRHYHRRKAALEEVFDA